MIFSNKRIIKLLIRLRGSAGWSAPVLSANPGRQVLLRRSQCTRGDQEVLGKVLFVRIAFNDCNEKS